MIGADIRRAYETDGVVCLRNAFDAGWLAVAADAIEQGRANPGPMHIDYSAQTKPGTYCGDFWIWRQAPAMRAFIFESPAARIVGELMGVPSVMLVTDNWLVRDAGKGGPIRWGRITIGRCTAVGETGSPVRPRAVRTRWQGCWRFAKGGFVGSAIQSRRPRCENWRCERSALAAVLVLCTACTQSRLPTCCGSFPAPALFGKFQRDTTMPALELEESRS